MTTNLYFACGPIAVIAATAAAARHPDDDNILVLEETRVPVRVGRVAEPGTDHDKVMRLLARALGWKRIVPVEYVRSYISFTQSPLGHLRQERRYDRDGRRLLAELGLKNLGRVYFSGNAVLWTPAARIARQGVTYLEHGLGDYVLTRFHDARRLRSRLRLLACRLFVGRQCHPDAALYLDNGQCRLLSKRAPGLDILIERRGPPPLAEGFERFRALYAEAFPTAAAELEAMLERLDASPRPYLYLPTQLVAESLYPTFLQAQMRQIPIDGARFLIKRHATDNGDYRQMFDDLSLPAEQMGEEINHYLPVEYLMYRLPRAEVVGTLSSALFYARWWFDRPVHFVDMADGSGLASVGPAGQLFLEDIAAFG